MTQQRTRAAVELAGSVPVETLHLQSRMRSPGAWADTFPSLLARRLVPLDGFADQEGLTAQPSEGVVVRPAQPTARRA